MEMMRVRKTKDNNKSQMQNKETKENNLLH
jgi:hypothetical protein